MIGSTALQGDQDPSLARLDDLVRLRVSFANGVFRLRYGQALDGERRYERQADGPVLADRNRKAQAGPDGTAAGMAGIRITSAFISGSEVKIPID